MRSELRFTMLFLMAASAWSLQAQEPCDCTVVADVVALEQPWQANRLGAMNPDGMMFALRRDVVPTDNPTDEHGNDILTDAPLTAGNVRLVSWKRPRPIVLRVSEGECLEVRFQNLLSTSRASFHVAGLELLPVDGQPGIASNGSFNGANLTSASVPEPGGSATYKYYARKEGMYFLYTGPSGPNVNFGQTGVDINQVPNGLFGSVNVQPQGAEYYRSQVTRDQLNAASYTPANPPPGMSLTRNKKSGYSLAYTDEDGVAQTIEAQLDEYGKLVTTTGHPLINYHAVYEDGTPVLSMTRDLGEGRKELVYTDLTAIITGPNAGRFPFNQQNPAFFENPASPDRRQPYREFTIIYHFLPGMTQSFPIFDYPDLSGAFGTVPDTFGINFGFAGIGAEIVANRIGVGPEGAHGDEVDLKFEEFFLSSWAVGDPGMVVNIPANTDIQVGATGAKATKALYPDDPSNVYHSYLRDHVKFRVANATTVAHVHHLHAHQWLKSPNSDDGHYLDSQLITEGTTFTMEITYNGSGNRNQTIGDSIFHCHFYPHFADGMWSLWRVHDVFESGTILDEAGFVKTHEDGNVLWNRALPDGEIVSGTPIPGLVPLPTLAMAPMPAPVRLSNAEDPTVDNLDLAGRRVIVQPVLDEEGNALRDDHGPVYENPGFPFFNPSIAGHRPTHPPMDYGWVEDEAGNPVLDEEGNKILLNGGLPRHQALTGDVVRNLFTRWDFSKDFILFSTDVKKDQTQETYLTGNFVAYEVPENGTAVERAAMDYHATRAHKTIQPDGRPGNFITNGLPPKHGAPYADPAVNDQGSSDSNLKKYKAANIQLDVVLNKKGWHYPQQRILALWYDVKPTISGERPPEPFFFRSHSGDTIEYWHTNLVPNYFDMDDFEVRTPTDVLGQHIHLVKFDVTSSDGAANGFNYEDGTFSPDEVRERIIALNNNKKGEDQMGGIYLWDAETQFSSEITRRLTIQDYETHYPFFGDAPAYQNWDGAQTTIQRWDSDPLLNDLGEDRTLRTVFTHDHFSPSTHQQAGLYAGLLVEPENSNWFTNAPSWSASATAPYEAQEQPAYTPMATRPDGGPTSWQAVIETAPKTSSYREFAIEFQDFQLAYTAGSSFVKRRPDQLSPSAVLFILQPGDNTLEASDTVPSWVVDAFNLQGIVLSDSAYITATPPPSCGTCGTVENAVLTVVDTTHETETGPCSIDIYPVDANNNVYAPCIEAGWADPNFAIDAPDWLSTTSPTMGTAPSPGVISGFPPNATYSMNYRSEPVPVRVNTNIDPAIAATDDPNAVDLSFALQSIKRLDPDLNRQPLGDLINPADAPFVTGNPDDPQPFTFPKNPLNFNLSLYDPYTPMLHAYQGDNIQVRTLVGAHIDPHAFQIQGVKWYFEPSYENSGYRALQGMGISEHFEMLFHLPFSETGGRGFSDWAYQPDTADNGYLNGLFGLFRGYTGPPEENMPPEGIRPTALPLLPNNPNPANAGDPVLDRMAEIKYLFANWRPSFKSGEEPPENMRRFHVIATTAAQALQNISNGMIVVNGRGEVTANSSLGGSAVQVKEGTQLVNPFGLVYVLAEDLDSMTPEAILKGSLNAEPLILRAAAGDWIQVRLENRFSPRELFTLPTSQSAAMSLNGGAAPDSVVQAFAANGITLDGSASKLVCYCAWQVADTAGTQYTINRKASDMYVYYSNEAMSFVEGAGSPYAGEPVGASSASDCSDTTYTLEPICLNTSTSVGLNPQLVSQDIAESNGFNLGFNPTQTVSQEGDVATYYWYAGNLEVENGYVVETPVELGAVNLRPSDPMTAYKNGLYAALIVEPVNSIWIEDAGSRASATVFQKPDPGPRDLFKKANPGQFLFRELAVITTENINGWDLSNTNPVAASPTAAFSLNYKTELPVYRDTEGAVDYAWMSNTVVLTDPNNIYSGDPETPVFYTSAGSHTRIRFLYNGGGVLNGPQQIVMLDGHSWQEEPFIEESRVIGDNILSQQLGSQQILPNEPLNLVLPSAGGIGAVPGDYALHTYLCAALGGNWGLMRVSESLVVIGSAYTRDSLLIASGLALTGPDVARGAEVALTLIEPSGESMSLGTVKTRADGSWLLRKTVEVAPGSALCATLQGGECGRPDGYASTVQIDTPPQIGAKTAKNRTGGSAGGEL